MRGLTLSVDGHVAVVTIDRPERANTLTYSMIERELPEIWSQIGSDPSIRAVVLTACPGTYFCAGMDVKDPELVASSLGERPIPRMRATAKQNGVFKPVVVAIGGRCLGGGLILMSDADVVIGSESACFGNPAVSVGQVATVGPTMLAKRGHFDAALRMTLLGSEGLIDSEEAFRLGIISERLPQSGLLARAKHIAAAIGANSPAAVQASLRNLWHCIDLPVHEALDNALDATNRWRNHPDALEGRTASGSGRPARWSDQPVRLSGDDS